VHLHSKAAAGSMKPYNMKLKEKDVSTRVCELQIGALMESSTKLNNSTNRRYVDMHEYFMLIFFLISNLECNQPTLTPFTLSPPPLLIPPHPKAPIPFLSIMKLLLRKVQLSLSQCPRLLSCTNCTLSKLPISGIIHKQRWVPKLGFYTLPLY